MKLFAVLGRPVGHSLSPEMHRAAYRALGIDAEYVRIDCAADEMAGIAGLVRQGVLAGVNITVPHKVAAFELADDATDEVRVLGAANTWLARDGKLIADNTDGAGFLWGLGKSEVENRKPGEGKGELDAVSRESARAISDFRFPASGTNALILGAGGAARSICLALSHAGWDVKLAAVEPDVAAVFGKLGGTVVGWQEEVFEALAPHAQLLVNATPLGMTPHAETVPDFPLDKLPGTAIVYDIVYNPRRTLFLSRATEAGLRTIEGTAMLVGQGARSFERWFDVPAPAPEMMSALERALDSGHVH